MVKRQKIEITLQRRRPFLGKIYQMINLSNFELRKMKLEGTWCTEDIDNEHLQLRVFSNLVMNATSSSSKGQRKFQRKNTS